MELSEILDRVMSAMGELEISTDDITEYQIHLSISPDSEDAGIISDVDKSVEIDEDEKIIYLTATLY